MNKKFGIEKKCWKILEENGGAVAEKAKTALLEDPALKDLQVPLEFVSKNWRDPLTPAMMSLSCKAVGGRPKETNEAALALSLINLSFYLWDDIIDKAPVKLFKPTLFGKFGEGTALMIGGLATAKAFFVLEQLEVEREKHEAINNLLWNLLVKMTRAETVNLKLRKHEDFSSKEKIWKIKTETTDLETCLRIGAIIGGGSEYEINCLGRYGRNLGVVLALWKDFHVSANLTLELSEKIRLRALPYSLLWAMERSQKLQNHVKVMREDMTDKACVNEVVESLLETTVLEHLLKIIRKYTVKAKEELCKIEKKNDAISALDFFIGAQPQLFIDSLRAIQT